MADQIQAPEGYNEKVVQAPQAGASSVQAPEGYNEKVVQAPQVPKTFMQKYVEPYEEPALVTTGGVVGGILGAPAFGGGAVVGAGLGAGAGESLYRALHHTPPKQQIVPILEAGAQGAAGEMGGQILNKATEVAVPFAKNAVGEGVNAIKNLGDEGVQGFKNYYSIGEPKPAIRTTPFAPETPAPAPKPAEPLVKAQPQAGGDLAAKLRQALGVSEQEMNPKLPLKDQLGATKMPKPVSELSTRRPELSSTDRQFAHANSEEALDAAKGDKKTMKAIHDLKNVDVQQAYLNGGGKYGAIQDRQGQIRWLLQNDHDVADIPKLAKPSK